MLRIRLWVTRKKSKRQWISGGLRRRVYLRVSGFNILHAGPADQIERKDLSVFSLILYVF